jgi:anti-anti-sigma regulatory factor
MKIEYGFETGTMIIDLNRIPGEDFTEVLREEVSNAIETGDELVIDFSGMKKLAFEEIRTLVTQGVKCRIKGVSLRMINIPEAIRGQFVMIGIQCREDEVIIN